jgi:uncharacterized repeat protein (TIGR01451 family)
VTYTVTITNIGPGLARNVDVKDQLPAGLSLDSVSAQSGVCAGTICQFGRLSVNETRTITVVARVASGAAAGTITNTAAVYSTDSITNPSATVTTSVATSVTLGISKVALANPVNAGGTALFQIVVTNNGPSDAANVRVTDTLPAGITYAGGDAACTNSGQNVTCSLGTLAAGASRTLLIQGNVNTGLVDGVSLTNLVSATTATVTPTVTATAAVSVREPVGGVVDLVVAKSGPVTATAGQAIVYRIVVTNSGPATATAVSLVDALPDGVSFAAASSTRGLCESGVSCLLGDMAANTVATVTVTGTVASTVVTNTALVNRAAVQSANPDSNGANNSSTFTTTAQALARLILSKSVTPPTAGPGGTIVYRIIVTNTGPSTARSVVVSDLLPSALLNPLVSSSQGGCTGFACALGDIAPDAAATILVVGTLADNAAGVIANTATVTSTTALATGSVTESTAALTAGLVADLVLTKQAPATARPGDTLVYTLTLRNLGPSTAADVLLTDTLPAGTTFVAATAGCGASGAVVTCTVGSLNADTTRVYYITATVNSDVYPGTSLENVAEVTTATSDPNPLDNRAVADTSIIGAANVTIAKTQVTANPIVAGEFVTYTITITNTGPGAARAVDVKDQLPSGMTLERVAASNNGVCGGPVCQFGDLAVNATRTVTVVARVNSAVTDASLTNTAGVYSVDDSTPMTDSVTTTITASAVLTISKVALNDPAYAGGVALYQIVVVNEGPSDAQNVVVTDTLPVSTTYAGGDTACSASGPTVTCHIGALAAGATRTLLVQANVNSLAADGLTLTNVVTATSPTAATPVTDVVTSTVRQPSGGDADLVISKHAADTVVAGEEITYTLVVTNRGPAVANDGAAWRMRCRAA